MAVCPICHAEFESPLTGQLCERCAAEVIARETYGPGDLRFVGILVAWLSAAILSMPGAFLGYYIGRVYDRASTGCLIGVIAMSLIGLGVGYVIGPRIVRKSEARRRSQT